MLHTLVLLFLFILHHLPIPAATAENPYVPIDYFLINCGSTSSTNFKGRNWDTDEHLKFLPSNITDVSSVATASEQDSSVDQVPYMTARIFSSQFTYAFSLSPGPKFLRLYFYPAPYSGGHDKTRSFFTVTANGYTLLSNFSAFLTVSATDHKTAFLIKEFIVDVKDNQMLNLTFSPSSNSYCFINGIEIVSMPYNLYLTDHDSNNPLKYVNQNSLFDYAVNDTAFETLFRLNVGEQDIQAAADTGMFRHWSKDDDFLYAHIGGNPLYRDIPIEYTTLVPSYTAPEAVYTTARAMGRLALNYQLTWIFSVDSGFHYMLRLHFCEITPDVIYTQNQRVFTITMNNKTAESVFDVIYQSGGPRIPIYRDYVVFVSDPNKPEIWLAIYPHTSDGSEYADAILNGLEIFKLNNTDGSLAGPNPEVSGTPNTPTPNPKGTKKNGSRSRTTIYAITGGVVGTAAVLLMLACLIFRQRKRSKDMEKSSTKSSWAPLSVSSRSTKTMGSTLPSDLCRSFSLEELKSATANFHDNFVIGRGGFGKVYKGYIDDGATAVAIKRLDPSSRQGAHEFTTEIEMLSKLRHVHLVSLIGYCDEQGEMILVYDYMANGTLRNHLYNQKNSPMPWKQRLQICIGAAKGLQYLHGGAKHSIIHRDVKSTNILLDEKWVAKVSDFGLSKMGPTGGTHVSTVVKGSFGYLDPEYFKRQQLTEKSDVYSFGVVLLEVLCARPVIIPNIPKEQVNLAEWGRSNYRNGSLEEIIDPSLKGEIALECLRTYGEIAIKCLKDRGMERPTTNDVVGHLEFALQLQEAAEKNEHLNLENPQYPLLFRGQEVTTTDDESISGSNELPAAKLNGSSSSDGTTTSSSDRLNSKTVFSEIMNPAGR